MYRTLLLTLMLGVLGLPLSADNRLTGIVIGTPTSVDYATGKASTTVNTCAAAFDGDLSTYFASYSRSGTWVGLDLGSPHIITRVAWSPRDDEKGPERVRLGLFEGSNRADFLDAVPLYLIPAPGATGQMMWADVDVSRGFRYVRYVGPNDARCNIAEVAFYGRPGQGDNTHYHQLTALPTLSIHIADNIEPYDKEHELTAWLTTIYDDGLRYSQHPIAIRLRGHASITFPKKPYRLRFTDGQLHRMFNGAAYASPAKAEKWTLINNYGDKSLMRNIVAMEISRRMGMSYTPYCQAVDVIVNGEYKGCYQLCDQVEVGAQRVDIAPMTRYDNSGEALTGGYLIEIDGYEQEDGESIPSLKGNPISIKAPDKSTLTSTQRAYIINHINEMERRLLSDDYTNVTKGYRPLLNVGSFVRYLLVSELAGNPDAFWSTYLWKQRGNDQLHVGPAWDFDLAFDNDARVYPVNSHTPWLYQCTESSAGNLRNSVNRLLNDPYVIQQMRALWQQWRDQGIITPEALQHYVAATAASISTSQQLNFMRWDILATPVHRNPMARGSWQAEVDAIGTYLAERIAWIDNKLQYTPTTNAIATTTTAPHITAIYDTQGRRHNTLQKGINIVRMSNGEVNKRWHTATP